MAADAADVPETARAAVAESLAAQVHLHTAIETAGGRARVLVEHLRPPRELLVAGRHYDAGPLVELARAAGWRVTLAGDARGEVRAAPDHEIALEVRALDRWLEAHPHAPFVVMTHSVALDRLALGAALRAGPRPYVGVLGPTDRTRQIVEALMTHGPVDPRAAANLKSPVGLPIGGEGAAAIALSILAELEQTFGGRTPTRRDGEGAQSARRA